MIIKIDENSEFRNVGNKGKFLAQMKSNGFNVPDGFILDSDCYDYIVSLLGINVEIERLLINLDKENCEIISKAIITLFDNITLPSELNTMIKPYITQNNKYAVRSSGLMEDLEEFSFAGQYSSFLNVQAVKDISNAVILCYKSMFSVSILSYMIDNKISFDGLKMSVVVQEMVDSEFSGVAFTVNPISGNDKTILVEAAMGLGENLVSGKVNPEQYYYNWYDNSYNYSDNNKIISKDILEKMMQTFLDIQIFFGYPCDIEFAVKNNELFILQSRAVTKIKYTEIKDVWTTADFKDGGVSAYVCTPYMWSLYEFIWEFSLRKFVLDSKILTPNDVKKKLGDMFYGRPYWNLTVVKKAMSSVPGYKEREFDSEYGIKITYDGNGDTTGINLLSIIKILKIAVAQRKILKERNKNAVKYKDELLEEYFEYKNSYDEKINDNEFFDKWYRLTKQTYLKSESTYFWQIFINTIHQSLYKDSLLKYVSESEYLSLLSGIDNISHLLPFYEIWDITRKIRNDSTALKYWTTSSIDKINSEIYEDKFYLNDVVSFIEKYGYHSDRELDVTYKCYYEDTKAIVKMFCDNVMLTDDFSPVDDKKRQLAEYQNQIDKIKAKVSDKKYVKIKNKIDGMRKMLWWREEFRDISTRFYYIIRIYTIKLAEILLFQGIIQNIEDIWMLKIEHLWDYHDNKLTQENIAEIIAKNKQYYNSFRNFTSENEIGHVFDLEGTKSTAQKDGIYGIGCNNGIVTGIAKVINGLEEIDKIEKGDILITKYTDTGWTCKFAMLSGIVTEYGGILCHAAIVSREYGIPCIVCATDVMKKIKNGSSITINGSTGEITIED